MASVHGTNQRVADRLLAEGRITAEDHRRVVAHATKQRGRIEDAFIELGIISEGELLKYVATLHNTRFVSTDKLSKAAIDQRVLGRVSQKTAKMHEVFPVLLDDAKSVLSVVTADPDNHVAMHEVKLAANVREVRALVARPAAVHAAIARYYFKDAGAFDVLLRSTAIAPVDNFIDVEGFGAAAGPAAQRGGAGPATPKNNAGLPPPPPPRPPAPTLSSIAPHIVAAREHTQPSAANSGANSGANFGATQISPPSLTGHTQQSPNAATRADQTQNSANSGEAKPVSPQPSPLSMSLGTTPPPAQASILESPEYLETLNVLVSMLEVNRPELRGHSSTVARLCRKACERLGLAPEHVSAFVIAAYLHDLGKMNGQYHLTALNVSEYEGPRQLGIKAVALPIDFMSSVNLPSETIVALSSMYERYDGTGFPQALAGKEIPLGARILAVADTYADLTHNPRNPFRKVLKLTEACEVLAGYRGTIFDPTIVDLFRSEATGDDMRARLLLAKHVVLLVDPGVEETAFLENKLSEQGFEIRSARSFAAAWQELQTGDITAVVSEIDLEDVDGGFKLRGDAQKEPWGRALTWVILTRKGDRHSAQRAFDLGVDDFVAKSTSMDIFAAKLRQLIERRAERSGSRGVSGSLAEMSLPEMVQVLWHGRKTGVLRIKAVKAGEIHFFEGKIIHAIWDQLSGEAAFYQMITLREGEFHLETGGEHPTRTITVSPEALLLEGMRLLDEGRATSGS
jgi:response regulator RpfG family c-di-GMP phosphodiesterase